MSVNSESFLSVARFSIGINSEIGYRMAIARSYYAMLHKVIESFEHYQYNPDAGGTHQDVYSYLANGDCARIESKDKIGCKVLAYKLQQAKKKRVAADYYLDLNFDEASASDAIKMSEVFFGKVDEVFQSRRLSA